MKTVVICVALLSACAALCAEVAALPDVVFADTEVSTNFTFAVCEGNNRKLVLSLDLQASPSNNVEVAIGCDANGDGHLSLDESGLAVGYDCGEWFVRSAEKDAVTSEAVSDTGTFRRMYEIRSRHVDSSWNLVKVTRRGFGVANESIAVEPAESGFTLRLN
jgi:hypothetical protein